MNQEKIWAYFQNEGAASFDASMPRYYFIVGGLQKYVRQPAHILNIGVGSGKLECLLRDAGYHVAALDPDAHAVDKLVTMGINARTGVAERIPFADGSFDAVIASEVLEHLDAENLRQAITEILRVLKPDGYFLGTVPYKEQLADNLTVCPHCGERFHRWGHRQSFDKALLLDMLGDGFQLLSLSRRTFVQWDARPLRFLKSLVKWLLGRMGEQITSPRYYFVLRKSPNA